MQPLFQVRPQFLLWIFLHPCVITCPAQRRSTLGARELRLDRWSARRLRRPGDGRQLAAGELDKVRRELAAYREFAVLSEALVAVNEAICEANRSPVAGTGSSQDSHAGADGEKGALRRPPGGVHQGTRPMTTLFDIVARRRSSPTGAMLMGAAAQYTARESGMARTDEPVAVLGIGAMGHGMAASALRAGIPTIVWNRRLEATRDLAERGAEVAETAADAARRAAIVVTMVTDTDAVMSIARDQGMLAALAPGAIWVQMSTIGVAGIDRVIALVAADRPDVTLLDAPVSGSTDPAEHGQLTILASGPHRARASVAALFDALGQRTIWVGEVGAGSRLKLVNNTWLAFASEAVAASVALARRLGLDTETVVYALGDGPLASTWQAAKLHRIAEGDFSAQFPLSLALKDVHLALEAADGERFTALAGLADEWQQTVDQGLGEQDLTVVTRALEQQKATP